jgi:hypothetical protein
MVQQSSIKSATVTKEALTFPVDYNDVTAVDPPAKAVFCTQASITQFLTAKGATNFKHLQAVWDSLPDGLRHDVTFNLAAGVHRPRNPETYWGAFNFTGKHVTKSCQIWVNGASSSNYTQLVTSQTITALSADPYNPWMDFAGTPFTGMNLRGYYVVFDTGQVSLVHKHTSSRLYVIDVPSPTPTSCFVGKPATILRNSYDDLVKTSKSVCVTGSDFGNVEGEPWLNLQDLLIENFGNGWGMHFANAGGPTPTRLLIDLANEFNEFGVNPSSTRGIQLQIGSGPDVGPLYMYGTALSIRGPAFATPPQAINNSWSAIYSAGGTSFLVSSYIGGAARISTHDVAYLGGNNIVYDDMPYGAIYMRSSKYGGQDEYYTGQQTIFRNCGMSGYPAITYDVGSSFYPAGGSQCLFENCVGPCIRLGSDSKMGSYVTGTPKLRNGPAGGNADVGIDVVGSYVNLPINSATDVSGTLGAVRMKGGDIHSYADIVANGPYTDLGLNVIEKAS